jgi:undecaprenyl-diphosphatase
MDFFQAFILSVVEGITEFLPISSTGHLILTSQLLGIPQSDFVKTFEIVIQSGAIAAVVFLYWRKLLVDRETLKRVIVAFIPTGILGLVLYKFVKDILLGNSLITVISLFWGGIAIILMENYFKNHPRQAKLEKLSYPQVLTIGLFQSLSMIPGVSRSAATIIGSMFLGMGREAAVEFSFLLAIPTMGAATGLDLIKNLDLLTSANLSILFFGFIVSFIVALLVVKWFIKFVQRSNLIVFGAYRIFVALAFLLLVTLVIF